MYQSQLRLQPIIVLLLLALTWGANMAVIKIGAHQLAPLFMAGLRSLVATICIGIWMKAKGIVLFPSGRIVLHGMVVGLLFASEFALIYVGLNYTLASRTYVLVYTAPFFVALGAHFLLRGDRLTAWKVTGLVFAFAGVVLLFLGNFGASSLTSLAGDLMALTAGALWGTTTVYIKKYLAQQALPLQTLFYQVFFSAPLLLAMSLLVEDTVITGFDWLTAFSVFYQCIVVASVSFIFWFELIHRYPVSLLHAFTFFTPVFGVFLSGALILGEVITLRLVVALLLVTIGMVMVNRKPVRKSAH
jgi:drug/metabolite transporter (DMT)-like permease